MVHNETQVCSSREHSWLVNCKLCAFLLQNRKFFIQKAEIHKNTKPQNMSFCGTDGRSEVVLELFFDVFEKCFFISCAWLVCRILSLCRCGHFLHFKCLLLYLGNLYFFNGEAITLQFIFSLPFSFSSNREEVYRDSNNKQSPIDPDEVQCHISCGTSFSGVHHCHMPNIAVMACTEREQTADNLAACLW